MSAGFLTREREPDHPLLAVFLPLLADWALAEQVPAAWRWLESLPNRGPRCCWMSFCRG